MMMAGTWTRESVTVPVQPSRPRYELLIMQACFKLDSVVTIPFFRHELLCLLLPMLMLANMPTCLFFGQLNGQAQITGNPGLLHRLVGRTEDG